MVKFSTQAIIERKTYTLSGSFHYLILIKTLGLTLGAFMATPIGYANISRVI